MILAMALRDVRLRWSGGALWLPVVFYLAVATLFPFAVGPDHDLLLRTGGGVLWIAALLAALLPVERLVAPDVEAGVIDQLIVRGHADEAIVTAKLLGHWLGFAPPLMIATVPAAMLMQATTPTIVRLLVGLTIASPALAGLGVAAATLTIGRAGAAALSGLLILPLAVPLLIFGAASVSDGDAHGALRLLAALAIVLTAGAPLVGGAALRALRE